MIEGYSGDHQESVAYLASSSSASIGPVGMIPSSPAKRPTSIRPLTAAYQASASQHQVSMCTIGKGSSLWFVHVACPLDQRVICNSILLFTDTSTKNSVIWWLVNPL